MVNVTSPEDWWGNLSEETQDRLATNPGGPVPGDLWAEVVAANTGTDLHPPFRSIEDHVLRGTFVALHSGGQRGIAGEHRVLRGRAPLPDGGGMEDAGAPPWPPRMNQADAHAGRPVGALTPVTWPAAAATQRVLSEVSLDGGWCGSPGGAG